MGNRRRGVAKEAPVGRAVCMYVCKDSAAPAHAHTRAHRPAAPKLRRVADTTSHGMCAGRHCGGARGGGNLSLVGKCLSGACLHWYRRKIRSRGG